MLHFVFCFLFYLSFVPQIDPGKFKSIGGSFKMIWAEQGAKGLYKGWGPTVIGYSLQGACKFGLYEYFKKFYSDLAGEPFGTDYKTLVYLAGSASAEFVADIALCPFEAVKVRVQTKPGYAKGLTDGMSKFIAAEGFRGWVTNTLLLHSLLPSSSLQFFFLCS
jgi:solute carrier family 25 phosphate transporter 3